MKTLTRSILILSSFLFLSLPLHAADAVHGLALHGAPRYPADFTHFDYANPDAPKGGDLRLSAIGTFDNLNPFILKGMAAADAALVFDTLMEASMDEPFSQYGRVAESVTVAPDRTWVSYRLRPEARFHDGKPVTPEDVVFSFETLRDKGHPLYRTYYKDVARAEKTAEREVKFVFKSGDNTELPLIMGQMPILARHDWKGKDFAATTLSPIVGSGPYKIDAVNPGRDITYRRVENWWGKNLPVNKGRYNFDTIRYDYYRDATVALEAFFAGKYDFRLENSAKNWATAYNAPPVKQGLVLQEEVRNQLPSGMQGFVMNLRRPIFQDRRVRMALAYAFDFEWGNKNIAYGVYKRTASYFAHSELAATDKPSEQEMKLLAPLRDTLPPEVFDAPAPPPRTDGSGNNRENLRKAADLLAEAGWKLKDGALVNDKGEAFTFDIVESSPLFERWIQPFLRNLERLGIKATYRVVDSSQYQNLLNDFQYDMTVHVFGQSLSPGNEQRDYWGSAKADQKGGRNLIGIKDAAIDALVEHIVHASSREDLVAATRALDRVLLAGHYVIPHWNFPAYRVAYWNAFAHPAVHPPYGFDMESLWWTDAEKSAKLSATRKK